MEPRLTPRYHGKSKHKRKPTKRHLRDKLASIEKEIAWWRELDSFYVITMRDKRIAQLGSRIKKLKEQLK